MELLTKPLLVITKYPGEENMEDTIIHTKVYSHSLTRENVKIKETEAGIAAGKGK